MPPDLRENHRLSAVVGRNPATPESAEDKLSPLDDALKNRRLGRPSDFRWVTRTWSYPVPVWSTRRSPPQLCRAVLESSGLQEALAEAQRNSDRSAKDLDREARACLSILAHKFKMPVVRIWGFFLSKLLKRLYDQILVETEGAAELRAACQRCPVVLVPNHRSYLDFLIMSFVTFHLDAPLPCAAAGDNLLSLRWVSSTLRHAGGFFIRRKFGDDCVYRALVTEYLHQMLLDGRHPLEVFVEGTRSRTGKSLPPRTGFVQACLELYRSEKVSDILFVPVSISYDRVLEETLYAREMLGLPKPKETIASLLSARKILGDKFGDIRVRFGTPVSARQTLALDGFSVPQMLTLLVKQQQRGTLSTHFPLACLILGAHKGSASVTSLLAQLNWLAPLAQRSGVRLESEPSALWFHEQVKLHRNFLAIDGDIVHVRVGDTAQGDPDILPQLLLAQYSNEALQWIEPCCKLALCGSRGIEAFRTLNKLLQTEFVYEEWREGDVFRESLDTMSSCDVLLAPEKTKFLASCLEPFLSGLATIADSVALQGALKERDVVTACQERLRQDVATGRIRSYSPLSLDFIKSSLQCLVALGAGEREQSGFVWKKEVLLEVANDARSFLCQDRTLDGQRSAL